jgi:hypothetical protein
MIFSINYWLVRQVNRAHVVVVQSIDCLLVYSTCSRQTNEWDAGGVVTFPLVRLPSRVVMGNHTHHQAGQVDPHATHKHNEFVVL